MKDVKAEILFNERVGTDYFKMSVASPVIARSAKPGQFVQVRCNDSSDPLLRRPFSIHRLTRHSSRVTGFEILYETVGRGTGLLSKKKSGESVKVLGPLGNGFTLPRLEEVKNRHQKSILIAGGIGVAPLGFLVEELAKKKINTIVLIGANTKNMVLCENDFKRLGAEVHVTTDDGSHGCKGLVSKLFQKILQTANSKQPFDFTQDRRTTIYACGPQPMLKCIAGISKKEGLECQVCVEEKMACGIGVCLGCAVSVRSSKPKTNILYKFACKDGPVFDADEIVWS
ncbi:dihydroorotate dehydrogenase electron transfer subunit [Candidatus Omnitrophota bacterium]